MKDMLRACLKAVNLDPDVYDIHSLRIGRTNDLWKMGMSMEHLKMAGRWRSNAVYKYLRN